MAGFSISGLPELQTTLERFEQFGARGLAMAVVRAGLQEIAQQMQENIKPQARGVTSDVGYRLNKKAEAGSISGKCGVGVGKRVRQQKTNRGNRGAGIHSGTWHWWVLGSFKTMNRRTRTGANRGRMPAQQPDFADRAKQRAQQRARAAMEAAMGRSIERFFSSR
jgi:hypothetical protein